MTTPAHESLAISVGSNGRAGRRPEVRTGARTPAEPATCYRVVGSERKLQTRDRTREVTGQPLRASQRQSAQRGLTPATPKIPLVMPTKAGIQAGKAGTLVAAGFSRLKPAPTAVPVFSEPTDQRPRWEMPAS